MSNVGAGATFFNLSAGQRRNLERYRSELREDLGQVLELLHQGALTAQIAKHFALTDAGAALRYAEGGGITGKVILVPDTT